MNYGVLGPLEVADGNGPVAVGGAKPRLLVALLLAERGRTVPVERLVDELWGDTPPATAAATLHTYISRLRRVLGPDDLLTDSAGYALRPADDRVDRDRFEAGVEQGRRLSADGQHAAAADTLAAALAEWRGSAFPELVDRELGQGEIVRLEELRRTAEEDLFDAELAAGRHELAIPRLESAVADEPLRERRWAQLLLALYRSGRQADALRRYQDVRRLLAEEMGIDPGPDLTRLEQAILMQDPNLELAGTSTPTRRPPRRALPAPVTSFIGRATEAAEVASALEANRLVTLVGPGGVGKTRLALELARERVADEPDELIEVVELAGVADPDWVGAVLVAAVGAEDAVGDATDVIAAALASRPTVIVLDNCEHVIDACAELLDELLPKAPDLRVLATSREPLGVPGEVVWRLAPMEVDDAVALFFARAGQAAPSEGAPVADLCERLDRLPLAIELAAARVRTMGLDALLATVRERFVALGSRRAGPERQRSLRALVEWSYDLLAPPDQQLFAALSVFAGSFEAAAVEAVTRALFDESADVVFRLAELADKSLLQPEPANRYRMLETVRHFAADELERMGLAADARQAHQQWFMKFAQQAKAALQSADQAEWLDRCERDLDNLRAAIERSAAHASTLDDALAIAAALHRFWLVRHVAEGWQLLDGVLAAATEDSAARAMALVRAGGLAERAGNAGLGREHQDAAIDMARRVGAREVEALALNELAVIHRDEGDLETARRLGRDALAIARTSNDPIVLGTCLGNLGGTYLRGGAHVEARAIYEEAVDCLRRVGDVFAVSVAMSNLAVAACQAGDLDAGRRVLGEAGDLHRSLGDSYGLAVNLNTSAMLAAASLDFEAAERDAVESLVLMREIGHRHNISIALGTLADVRIGSGRPALDVLEEKLALDRKLEFTAGEATALLLLARDCHRRGDHKAAEEHATAAVERARASGNDVVLGEALVEAGDAAAAHDRSSDARAAYEAALAIFEELQQHPEIERCKKALDDLGGD
ncbi:MAG TPA: BTAD domain-containing putative transcriptional regulator [Acidimicrobiales bacterium]|nr:BTAD domain-containing putative transcriptional regulator [Acidimicrobiales bacterium]